MKNKPSQSQRILAALHAAGPGNWVAMPELASASGSYNVATRVSVDLRAEGYPIENKVEVVDGIKYSFYRLPVQEDEQEAEEEANYPAIPGGSMDLSGCCPAFTPN